MRTIVAALALATALFAGQAAAQNIDTTAAADSTLGVFGVAPYTATLGQTITIPAGSTRLTSFGFKMLNVPSTVVFRGAVYPWSDTYRHATGPALYESSRQTTTGATPQLVTFSPPGGVTVTPGQKYVIFVTTSLDQAGASGFGFWAAAQNPYADGHAVLIHNDLDPIQWTSSSWDIFPNSDFGFVANFDAPPAPVPTLSEWAMILFGLVLAGGAVVMVQRRRLAA